MTPDTADPISGRLLTLREAAQFLRLHPRTLREYLRRGELQGRVIGGRDETLTPSPSRPVHALYPTEGDRSVRVAGRLPL